MGPAPPVDHGERGRQHARALPASVPVT